MDLLKNRLQNKETITAVGLMSGTSLDGLDIALCRFTFDQKWHFELMDAVTVSYDEQLKNRLKNAGSLSSYEFIALHKEYGKWTGEQVADFIKDKNAEVDLISSHGHTVFHEPHKKLNFQTGDGAMIAAVTGITTVSDFRTFDIALGGQGAPLIPIVDRDLFGEYEACVNIGGFANVSLDIDGKRRAWDICPANIILNRLAQKKGFEFDRNGDIGKSGKVIASLLETLESLNFYKNPPPKSLSTEWLDEFIFPLIKNIDRPVEDVMATFYEHAARRIAHDLNAHSVKNTLFTGGGVKNGYLISLIEKRLNGKLIIPEEKIVDYKEAIGFAYLGILRIFEMPNCLSTVTGAVRDSSSGVVTIIN